ELRCRHVGAERLRRSAPPGREIVAPSLARTDDDWTAEYVTSAESERERARLRDAASEGEAQPNLRTSVMTHIAWAPTEWQSAAEETLAGMAEGHPAPTLPLLPEP